MNKSLRFQKVLGVTYMIAGVAKAVPALEDVPAELKQFAASNQGTMLQSATDWLAAHGLAVTVFVGLAMFGSGLVLFLDRALVRAASVGQIAMLCVFVLIIHRTIPPIFVVDGVFMAAAAYVLVTKTRRLREATAA